MSALRHGSLALLLAAGSPATCRGETKTEATMSDAAPPGPTGSSAPPTPTSSSIASTSSASADRTTERADVSGRLLYADGTPAAGVPFEVEAGGMSVVGTTDPQGRFTTKQAPGAAANTEVTLRLLDGFGVGLAGDIDGVGNPTVVVPVKSAGQLEEAYLLGAPKAMVLVTAPENPSAPTRRAILKLDLVGVHREREILTMLGPARIAELRALGLEVLVLDVDANAYAAKTGPMSDAERLAYIDGRIQAARVALARLTASTAPPR